jgi:glutathione-regulated potassium-efflux system ancillary protein KefG
MPQRVLILFAHPALHRSRMNMAMVEAVQGLKNVTICDLYEEYPDFHIEVPEQQRLLREHDVIIWQHPFFWYSAPALLKEWLDVVLEYGFAYGHEGTALQGKKAMNALTSGGSADSYGKTSLHRFTVTEFLAPFDQTAHLCGMQYLEPFILHDVHHYSPEQVKLAAAQYRQRVMELSE